MNLKSNSSAWVRTVQRERWRTNDQHHGMDSISNKIYSATYNPLPQTRVSSDMSSLLSDARRHYGTSLKPIDSTDNAVDISMSTVSESGFITPFLDMSVVASVTMAVTSAREKQCRIRQR